MTLNGPHPGYGPVPFRTGPFPQWASPETEVGEVAREAETGGFRIFDLDKGSTFEVAGLESDTFHEESSKNGSEKDSSE